MNSSKHKTERGRDCMKDNTVYEWCCEYFDCHGDIEIHDFNEDVRDVWPPNMECDDRLNTRLALIKLVGNDDDGEKLRTYAYKGDTSFCNGDKIPNKLFIILN